ncbi:HNH endonuclease signature motif containing protein [Microbacterium aurantiacum]|uniref:HNH endonuclease signature motif containing protein n=1 Tax=Microbacterium aurantiacum TaxID=162393 RepID=UPI000A96DDCC|nr:HNH endonuclease signature motif containing protein [Microbacterium chocolatum]
MNTSRLIEFSEEDLAELDEVAQYAETMTPALGAMEVGNVRNQARAGAIAERVSRRLPASVRSQEMVYRSVAAELAGVTFTTDRSMQAQITQAVEWVECYPATLAAWEAGRITRGHATAVLRCGTVLPRDARAEFDAAAAELCVGQSVGRVKDRLDHLAQELHPRTLAERHVEARKERRVGRQSAGDAMSDLIARVPEILAAAIDDRLNEQASTIIDADPDGRTRDQIRADILCDMLLTGSPLADPTIDGDGNGTLGMIRAKVQVVVPALTLLGKDDDPANDTTTADLVGSAPIDPATARALAGAVATWERLVVHPVSGQVLCTDSYRRTASMARFLKARDRHCRFPGCRRPAIRCELDHTLDYALGGRTDIRNLCHLCQRHHSMKQFTSWGVRQLGGGVLEWTSPTGRVYIDHPPAPLVRFMPSGGGAPPPDAGGGASPPDPAPF